MTTEAKAKKPPMRTIGSTPCPACDESAPVKEQANGLAAITCQWCGYQAYARGEDADRHIRAKMKPSAVPANPATPAKPAAPAKPEAPAKPAKKSLLEDL